LLYLSDNSFDPRNQQVRGAKLVREAALASALWR